MKQYKVRYSPEALEDLKGIYSYIYYDLSSPVSARNQIDRIRKSIRNLDTFPNKLRIVDFEPWHSMNMHQLPVDNYVVFFFVSDEKHIVDISRIF